MLARMPLFVNRMHRGPLLLSLGFALLAPAPLPASDDESAALKRWEPAVAFQGGVLSQTASATISTSEVYGACWLAGGNYQACRWTPPENRFLGRQEGPASASSRMMTPYFSLATELMSPSLLSGWGSPRAVAHADVGYSFAFDRGITRIGSPLDEMELPFPPEAVTPLHLYNSEQTIVGQGARATASVESLLVGAGLGLAFTFEIGDKIFRVKPTVEYLREEIEISGTFRQATRVTFFNPPTDVGGWHPSPPPCGGECFGDPVVLEADATPTDAGFREIKLDGSSSRVYHGVGPGLELEMDTGRVGPFVVSIYSGMRAYHFSGDLSIDFIAQNTPNTDFTLDGLPQGPGGNVEGRSENLFRNCSVDNANECESASFSFQKERWAYTGHLGLRFRFSPE